MRLLLGELPWILEGLKFSNINTTKTVTKPIITIIKQKVEYSIRRIKKIITLLIGHADLFLFLAALALDIFGE